MEKEGGRGRVKSNVDNESRGFNLSVSFMRNDFAVDIDGSKRSNFFVVPC